MKLQNAVAVVTGGSKGYGFGIAEALRDAGATVWITGRDEKALGAAAARIGAKAFRADVASGADWDRLTQTVLATDGRLDILINNAGGGVAIAPVCEQADEAILDSIRINLIGAILGCKRAARIMQAQKSGTIVNISSVCALHAWPGWSVYTAAKAGLGKFSHGLYTELRPFGVRVTTLTPSWGATEFNKAVQLPEMNAETRAKSMSPRQMGDLVAQLCLLPDHLVVPDLIVQPLVQEIIPL